MNDEETKRLEELRGKDELTPEEGAEMDVLIKKEAGEDTEETAEEEESGTEDNPENTTE